jgi:hypothetical protein
MPENSIDDLKLLARAEAYKQESENLLSSYHNKWSKSIQLLKGIMSDDEKQKSKVRRRSKLFFRKIWATSWRLVAAFYAAFLKDQNTFEIEGRDRINDPRKAKILQFITEYRMDLMKRTQDLFIKLLWGFQDITNNGICYAKLFWEYDPATKKDGPVYTPYPPEQCFPDMVAATKSDMRFFIFESYPTMDQMKLMKYQNLDKIEPENAKSSEVRNLRHVGGPDPQQNPGDTEYPTPGSIKTDEKEAVEAKYVVWEMFYRVENGDWWIVDTAKGNWILKPPRKSKYKNRLPIIMGLCLTEAHKLIGEDFPNAQEAPQKSLNDTINKRKDSLSLALNDMKIVNRYGNVDIQSLQNSRAGGIVMADDVTAVQRLEHRDPTTQAYLDASADEAMMQEISGIEAPLQGRETAEKATTAQINFQNASVKMDLYIGIAGETFIREFFSLLAYEIQLFETDKHVLRVANDSWRLEEGVYAVPDELDLEFEANCIVNVGVNTVGRQQELGQLFTFLDRATMSNQGMIQLVGSYAKIGLPVPTDIRLIDTTKIMEDIMPLLGKKSTKDYYITLPSQQPPQGQPGGPNVQAGLAGRAQPQIAAPSPAAPNLSAGV